MSDMDHAQFARLERARLLTAVIAETDPADACQIMAAALEDLGAGQPDVNLFNDIREQAREWADFAHPAELEAYFGAALRKLGNAALGEAARKRLLVRLWESLSPKDRGAFLSKVDPEGRFRRAAA